MLMVNCIYDPLGLQFWASYFCISSYLGPLIGKKLDQTIECRSGMLGMIAKFEDIKIVCANISINKGLRENYLCFQMLPKEQLQWFHIPNLYRKMAVENLVLYWEKLKLHTYMDILYLV